MVVGLAQGGDLTDQDLAQYAAGHQQGESCLDDRVAEVDVLHVRIIEVGIRLLRRELQPGDGRVGDRRLGLDPQHGAGSGVLVQRQLHVAQGGKLIAGDDRRIQGGRAAGIAGAA